jgi:hypothetical protein
MATRATDLRPDSISVSKRVEKAVKPPHYNQSRYSWRSTPSQLEAIAHLRFKDEKFDPFINRILKRLVNDLQARSCEVECLEIVPSHERKMNQTCSFRAEDLVSQWIEGQRDRGYKCQLIIDWMLGQCAQMVPSPEMYTQAEILKLIRQSLKGKERDTLRNLLDELKEKCSEERAKEVIKNLADIGKVTLVTGKKDDRVKFSGDDRLYKYIQIKPLKSPKKQ